MSLLITKNLDMLTFNRVSLILAGWAPSYNICSKKKRAGSTKSFFFRSDHIFCRLVFPDSIRSHFSSDQFSYFRSANFKSGFRSERYTIVMLIFLNKFWPPQISTANFQKMFFSRNFIFTFSRFGLFATNFQNFHKTLIAIVNLFCHDWF